MVLPLNILSDRKLAPLVALHKSLGAPREHALVAANGDVRVGTGLVH